MVIARASRAARVALIPLEQLAGVSVAVDFLVQMSGETAVAGARIWDWMTAVEETLDRPCS